MFNQTKLVELEGCRPDWIRKSVVSRRKNAWNWSLVKLSENVFCFRQHPGPTASLFFLCGEKVFGISNFEDGYFPLFEIA